MEAEAKQLRLSLKRKWFDMTAAEIKLEDYRKINPYWCKRLFEYEGGSLTKMYSDFGIESLCEEIESVGNRVGLIEENLLYVLNKWGLSFKKFDINVMTLGYPSKNDLTKMLFYENHGISISFGDIQLGAEPNELYFVIKHGARI